MHYYYIYQCFHNKNLLFSLPLFPNKDSCNLLKLKQQNSITKWFKSLNVVIICRIPNIHYILQKKNFSKLHGLIVSKGSCKVVWFDLNHKNTCSNEVKFSSQTSLSQLEWAYLLMFPRLARVFWMLVNIMLSLSSPLLFLENETTQYACKFCMKVCSISRLFVLH